MENKSKGFLISKNLSGKPVIVAATSIHLFDSILSDKI